MIEGSQQLRTAPTQGLRCKTCTCNYCSWTHVTAALATRFKALELTRPILLQRQAAPSVYFYVHCRLPGPHQGLVPCGKDTQEHGQASLFLLPACLRHPKIIKEGKLTGSYCQRHIVDIAISYRDAPTYIPKEPRSLQKLVVPRSNRRLNQFAYRPPWRGHSYFQVRSDRVLRSQTSLFHRAQLLRGRYHAVHASTSQV
jgi:hypothetical protein